MRQPDLPAPVKMPIARIQTHYRCEAAVDWGLGPDGKNQGYWCQERAEYAYSRVEGSSTLLCEACFQILRATPRRITLINRTPESRAASCVPPGQTWHPN